MRDVVSDVKEFIYKNKLILKNDIVGCALSGGADSIFMTFLLNKISKEMNFKILAIHINHMLRGKDSYLDEEFVKKFCKENDISLKSYRIDVLEYRKKNKVSLEMAGREVRYNIFEDLRNRKIITKCSIAHHADDDVETILMRIFRGTGIKGIEGIKKIRDNFYIRPIIFLRQNIINSFLNENKIEFIVDKSNFSFDYLRNRIRLSIIPNINENFSTDVANNILNLKELSQYDNEFFDDLISKYLDEYVKIFDDSVIIDIKCFEFKKAILFRIIRQAILLINDSTDYISLKHIKYIIRFSDNENKGSIQIKENLFCLRQDNYIKIFRKSFVKDNVESFCEEVLSKNEISLLKNGEIEKVSKDINFFNQKLKIQFTLQRDFKYNNLNKNSSKYKYFSLDNVKDVITIRNRRNGDVFKPFGMKGLKKLKKFFIDEKILDRDKVPLICFDDTIVWVFGVRNSEEYRVLLVSKKVVKIEIII